MEDWISKTAFYHIYPLGLCGAPKTNDYSSSPTQRLESLHPWLEHMAQMGLNGLYIGPLFESVFHGYDTTDYHLVDRRLGDNRALQSLVKHAHDLNIRVILDGVFNHVGRDFFAFKDVLANRQQSQYCNWFAGLRFDQDNHHHDGFSYTCWEDHETLPNLNLSNPDVRSHLFGAVRQWIDEFKIDGLRLDAANVMDKDFLSALAEFCKTRKPDFWLMGEVVAGEYTQWACKGRLDSVTNYEAFKGLYSSFNDHNFFEINWTLEREFGEKGLCRDLLLYSFADNHDVSRVATLLKNPAHLLPLYTLLFSMPGVPSIYYGSEFGIRGRKEDGDHTLRPALDLVQMQSHPVHPGLVEHLSKLIAAHKESPALQHGTFQKIFLTNEQYAFSRCAGDSLVIAAFNASDQPTTMLIPLPQWRKALFTDMLEAGFTCACEDGVLHLDLPPCSSQLLLKCE